MAFLNRSFKIIVVLALAFLVLLGYAYFVEPNTLVIKNQTIKLDCLKNDLPDKFVQISDLHFTDNTKEARINQIYETIKSQNPVAVFITGDLITNETGIDKAIQLVEKIAKDYPLFIVFGNWDYWALGYNVGEFKTRLEAVGAKVLVNDAVEIISGGERLNILGVKDPYTSGELKDDIERTQKNLDGSNNNCQILLAHSPNIIEEAVDKNIDLILVGHTHGGQVYIPFLTKYMVPAKRPAGTGFVKGLYKIGDAQMYINQGIGVSTLPFRFFVPPEVTVIKLEKNN